MVLERSIPIGCVDIRPEDVEAAARVLRSGRLRQGEVTAAFEEAFATLVGARHAVAVSSGTAALHLAYLATFAQGDEVIVPSFTFVATASMLVAIGAVPVLADVDERTFTISVEDVMSRITDRTTGIVGVHLFGNACDVTGLAQLAVEHRLTVVWDAAQALGTAHSGRDIGGFPTAVCYSFYPSKNITTGEGGMIVTDDVELAHRLRLMRSHGAVEKYVHTMLGFNYRMTDVQAAIGLEQLRRLPGYLARRRENARLLTNGLVEVARVQPPIETVGGKHSFNQYCVLLGERGDATTRDAFALRLAAAGVETAVHYPRPLHHQPLFQSGGHTDLPVSEDLARRIVALPVHPGISEPDVEVIVEAARGAMDGG
jgi:perosamine synthetase